MGKNGPIRRSPVPTDLRTAGPSGEVQKYWQPEAFTWYGTDSQRSPKTELYFRVSKTTIAISNLAAIAAGFEPGDKLQVGVNKGFLAIKKDDSGMVATGERKKTKSVRVAAAKLLRQLASEGYPIPCRLICQWDTKSQMLVGAWPKEEKAGQVAL